MPDSLDGLTPEEREEWNAFVEHFRRTTLEGIKASAMFMHLAADAADFNLKFAMELGSAILLDKPLLVVASEGQEIPEKLKLISDEIVYADVDTEEGGKKIAAAIERMRDA